MTALGHLSTGLLLKGRCPRAPLPLLLLAAALPDVLWAALNLLRTPARAPLEVVRVDTPFRYVGDQHLLVQPWSHALASNLLLAAFVAAMVYLAYRDRRVSGAVGLAVFGHWVLDFLVHDADLTLWPSLDARPVGPPFSFDAAHPARGLFSTHPLWGFALQTLVVVMSTAVFLRAFPVAQRAGRWKMAIGMTLLAAASLPLFLHGAMTEMIGGSTELLLGAVVEMVVMGVVLAWLARFSVGSALDTGPLDGPEDEAVRFVHRLFSTAGVGCLVVAAVYMLQSMLDAQAAPRIGWTSMAMALAFVLLALRFFARNPFTLWLAAGLGFLGGPAVRIFSDAGRLGPTLLLLELGLAFGAAALIATLLRRNLSL
ncbi:MAG: hypothetical protein KA712_03880 [Myxococcales bacterium]|nr:hypothetical protein [Myxococcales bacterium]